MSKTIEERLAALEASQVDGGSSDHEDRLVNIEHLLGVQLPLVQVEGLAHPSSLGNHDTETEDEKVIREAKEAMEKGKK